METQQINFLLFCALALTAGTVRTIKYNLCERPAEQWPSVLVLLFHVLEHLLWIGCVLTILVAAPHPITPVILVIVIGTVAVVRRMRFVEEQQSLNAWMQLASKNGQPIPELLDQLGSGYRMRIACAAKKCARWLSAGQPFFQAVQRSRLPIDATTYAMLVNWEQQEKLEFGCVEPAVRNSHPLNQQVQSIEIQKGFGYIGSLLLLAWAIGWVIRQLSEPLLAEFRDEYGLASHEFNARQVQSWFESVVMVSDMVAVLFVVWITLALLINWFPCGLAKVVPWFGKLAIDRWRLGIFRSLEREMEAGVAERDVFSHLMQTTRNSWVRSHCKTACDVIGKGQSLGDAMRYAKLVSPREQAWLKCAGDNQNLDDAISRLSSAIERRRDCLWRIRMAWSVPLATALVGVYVLFHMYYLFFFLSSMINQLAGG